MTGDRKLADFRRWALDTLGLLSADPEKQVEYLRSSGVEAEEILLQFDDVMHVARARVADGSLNHEDYLLLQAVNESANSVSAGPESIWTEGALEEASEWEAVRTSSRLAKAGLGQSWSQEVGD